MKDEKQPRESLRVLNAREKKEINRLVNEQWGATLDKSLVFLMNNKEKLYIANPDINKTDFSKMKIDSIGLYFCTVSEDSVRLSIEGSQIIGPEAKKNVIDISDDELREWFRGQDIVREVTGCTGAVILRHGKDFVGCGKVTAKGILNFVPKPRRILSDKLQSSDSE